jgi:LuxR family maltose regulon positive regulatory protein
MATQILSTKLHIPHPSSNLVSRPRLLERLNEGWNRKLTLVSAPAGYGKTTLLSEWISKSEMPFCWLSLDEQDNDINRFLSYLLASFDSIHFEFDEHILIEYQSHPPDDFSRLMIPLINQISDSESHFSLVLDDYHLIENQEIHEAVIYLLENIPQTMHLVIVSRTDPPVRLAQWRARGELSEIRVADLRFTIEEAIHFLNQSMGLDLKVSDITTLTDKTEGWIAGLQLAAISLHNHPDRSTFVTTFAGDDRYIADYLLDEALRWQPNYIQTFLLQTSILDRLCASLCDTVTDRNDSRVILKELERSNLFLIPLDNQRNWYRYHHLFADLLRIRLNQEDRESMVGLYQRASSWHEKRQMVSEAVRLSLLGDDAEKVAKLMEGHLLAIVSTSELSTLNRLLASLPEGTLSKNPWLALAMAWGMAYEWKFESIEPLLDEALSTLRVFDEKTQDRLKGRISVLRSYVAGARRDYANSIRIAQNALRDIPDNDLSMRSFTLLIIGNAYRHDGNLERALEFHNDAVSHSEEVGDTFLSVIILSRLTDIYRIMGQLNRAYKTGNQALEMVKSYQKQTGTPSFISGYLKLRLSDVYYERNELEMALQSAEVGLDLARQWGAYDSTSLGYFNFAKINMALGNYRQAYNYLREFKETYPSEHRLQYKIASAIETEIHLHTGNLQGANDWMESCGLSLDDHIQFMDFQFYDVLAQVLIAGGQLSDAQVMLERLLKIAEETGAVEYEIRTLGRIALVLQKQGDEDTVITVLARALNLAAPEGYLRTFIDQGESMAQMVYQASLRGINPAFCNQLLDGFSISVTPEQASQDDLVEPLSNREVEILTHIAEGDTNQEIAQNLHLSLYTVKSHARNIYSKLGVKNRTEAVSKARLLGILPKNS